MPTYISLLRGINVGGNKKIKMADLKAMYESLDFQNVETYIQSGNVIFDSKKKDRRKLEQAISEVLENNFGVIIAKNNVTIAQNNQGILIYCGNWLIDRYDSKLGHLISDKFYKKKYRKR